MTDIVKVFGNKVRSRRVELGITQEELAELTGLHRTYISLVERGNRSIGLTNIGKIANALNIDIGALFNE